MLQLCCWNINGFSSQKLLDVNIDKYDVFSFVETWNKGESAISLPGFISIHEIGIKKKGKRGRRSGGIILYFKKHLSDNKAIVNTV